MVEQLNFVLKLSLEEMALRRMVVNLWNESDVLTAIRDFRFEEDWPHPSRESEARNYRHWRENVEKMVHDKVSKLVLPESLKTRMKNIVRPIGLEILEWKIFHEQFEVPVSGQLCWTSAGVVDYEKTAEKITRLETVDIKTRYELACLYCLEDRIQIIWHQLSEEGRKGFYEKLDHLQFRRIPLELCWPYILEGEQSKLDDIVPKRCVNVTFHQYAFLSSACVGNKGATQYFLKKLTDEERDSILQRAPDFLIKSKRYSPKRYYDFSQAKRSEILWYLLSQMLPEERIQILKLYPGDILNCLLDWPWQDFLLDTADFVWTFLPENLCGEVLHRITKSVNNAAYSFPKLFQDFLLRSPEDFRNEMACSLDSLIFSGPLEVETVQLILRNADRVEMIYSYGFFAYVSFLVKRDEWRAVETLLREVMLSEKEIQFLKESFREIVLESDLDDEQFYRGLVGESDLPYEQLWETNLLERFFELLDEIASNTQDII